jgi:hypothetical protein
VGLRDARMPASRAHARSAIARGAAAHATRHVDQFQRGRRRAASRGALRLRARAAGCGRAGARTPQLPRRCAPRRGTGAAASFAEVLHAASFKSCQLRPKLAPRPANQADASCCVSSSVSQSAARACSWLRAPAPHRVWASRVVQDRTRCARLPEQPGRRAVRGAPASPPAAHVSAGCRTPSSSAALPPAPPLPGARAGSPNGERDRGRDAQQRLRESRNQLHTQTRRSARLVLRREARRRGAASEACGRSGRDAARGMVVPLTSEASTTRPLAARSRTLGSRACRTWLQPAELGRRGAAGGRRTTAQGAARMLRSSQGAGPRGGVVARTRKPAPPASPAAAAAQRQRAPRAARMTHAAL